MEEAGGVKEEQTGGGDGEDQEGEWERQRRLRREEAALESLIDSELQIEKVIKWASEEEFELRRRFCKYAAMAIACCEKDREMRVSANCCRGATRLGWLGDGERGSVDAADRWSSLFAIHKSARCTGEV